MDELVKVGQRIQTYLKYKGIGINQLGRLSDTSGAQVSNIIKGKKFGLDKIYTLFKVLPDLSPNWLLFGEGEMLKSFHKEHPTELEVLMQDNESLKKEIVHLRTLINYQEVAIEAYRKSFDLVNGANDDMKQVVEHYKKRSTK